MGWSAERGRARRSGGEARRRALVRRAVAQAARRGVSAAAAFACFAAFFGAAPLGAQTVIAAADRTWDPPDALSARVAAAVAARWGVEPAAVRLEWGVVREGRAPGRDAAFRLVGSGAAGAWVVAFEPASGRPPVSVRVRAGVERTEPVAARDLERGVVLTPADIAWRTVVHWGAPSAPPEVAPGWVVRRRLAMGAPLRAPAVAPPDVVTAGDAVRVVWRRGGVSLTLRGTAIGSAALGEGVAVRTATGRRLEGIAAGPALVHIEVAGEGRS